MKIQFKPAFSEETLKIFISQIAQIINQNENGSVLNLARRDQLYRAKLLQDNQKTFQKFLKSRKLIKYLFLDLSTQKIEDEIDLKKYLEENIRTTKYYTVLFILDADKLLDERSLLLGNIDRLQHQLSGISIIYFFQKNITLNKYRHKFSRFSSCFQNIVVFPYYQKNDCQIFISQLEQRFNIQVPDSVSDLILDRCGGHFWLIKQAVRQFSKDRNEKNIFNSEDMLFRLKVIADEFEPEEIDLLEKIIKKDFEFSLEEKNILNFFVKNRFLYKQGRQYLFSIPILKDYLVEQLSQKIQLKINERKQILINNVITDGYFSKKERKVICSFVESKGKIITREDMAEVIWGSNYQDVYTDWALDQLIKRLRNKFVKLDLSPKLIKTIKNQGYIFNG